jgi:P4 family phage/plasmid primase-like protien
MNAMKALCQNDEKVIKELAEAVQQTPESVFEKMTDLNRFTGDLTELGLAVALSDTYGYCLRHNKAFGWIFWDGIRWVLDAEAEANMLIAKFTDDFYNTAQLHMRLAADKDSEKRAKAELAVACKLRTAAGISHIASLLKTIVNEPKTEIFDANPWDLNTPDGIIDLRTGDIKPHDPKARCTKSTNVSPGSTGNEKWLAFIEYITNGDKEFASYLQTLAGMAAVGRVYEEGLVISYGPGGNGKSTLFGVLSAVLGDYAKTVNADVLVASNGKTDQTFIVALRGVRLAVLGETEDSAVMSTATLKRLTSQDVIAARALYKDPIEFTPTHTTIMHTNHLPRLTSTDGGTKRRIAVAPFPATLPPEKVIKDYKGVLFQECGPAILKWIIDGAISFYSNQCKLPKAECVKKSTEKYLKEEDWLQNFVSDCCETGDEYSVRSGELYAAYQAWAGSNGIRPKCSRDFSTHLELFGYEKRREQKGITWEGIKLQEIL